MDCELCGCSKGEGWCSGCSKTKNAANRQQLRRDRLKAGLVRIEVWVPADKADDVRKAVKRVLAEVE
jgi:hypothetical protein